MRSAAQVGPHFEHTLRQLSFISASESRPDGSGLGDRPRAKLVRPRRPRHNISAPRQTCPAARSGIKTGTIMEARRQLPPFSAGARALRITEGTTARARRHQEARRGPDPDLHGAQDTFLLGLGHEVCRGSVPRGRYLRRGRAVFRAHSAAALPRVPTESDGTDAHDGSPPPPR